MTRYKKHQKVLDTTVNALVST